MSKPAVEPVKTYLMTLQDAITRQLQSDDNKLCLREDAWNREGFGSGRTRAFENGAIYEKAGVNFSHVKADRLPESASHALRPGLKDARFEAVGISLIIHPWNPYVPTCHANLRLFSAVTPEGKQIWWFGGGFDLTPYYGFEEDCVHWHRVAKAACDPFGHDTYDRYKKWADDYFYLTHRNEPRGIGGLFFDDINQWDFETCFAFIQSVGDHFINAYFPIVDRRKDTPYGQRHRDFQCYRRGRYVEFNLVYDRGTLFGLQSGGRIESILISLPPLVSWHYNWQPEPGSEEAELYTKYLMPRDWLNEKLTVES